MDAFAGRTLTHYQVLEKLGEGGMGVVYKARDTRLNRLVAINADCDFIVMELVSGRTLDPAIGRVLKLGDTLKFVIQTAGALTAAHRASIVHRDLKPGNVMVTDCGTVKVLDFGLAKLTEAAASADEKTRTENAVAPRLTERGAIVGTVAYMSPEQAEGRNVDARSPPFRPSCATTLDRSANPAPRRRATWRRSLRAVCARIPRAAFSTWTFESF